MMIPGIMLGLLAGFAAGAFATFLIVLKMVAKGEERKLLRLGAFACSACPVCIFQRSKPDSDLGKVINAVEKGCPFCLSFRKLKEIEKTEESMKKD